MIYAQLIAGFIYLLGGGDLLVRGAVALARKLRVPPVVVALSVVAFGTSLPELMVSIRASISGYPNLILGNVVGSNTANVLLVGGAAAAVYPLRLRGEGIRRPGSLMLIASFAFAFMCLNGGVSRLEGLFLLGGLTFGMISTFLTTKRVEDDTTPVEWVLGVPQELPTIAMFIIFGVTVLPLGADLLVEAAVEIAENFGVSETVVGLSIVAIGTSLPEVATSVLAALRRRPGMAIGTIIGSNSFNLLAIMGIAAVLSPSPVPVSRRFLVLDLPVMLSASVALVGAAWVGRVAGRGTGALLLAAYALYLVTLLVLA